jgi:hypothetical protein
MKEQACEDLEAGFEAVFGAKIDGQFWRGPLPLVRITFGNLDGPGARVDEAIRISQDALAAIFDGSSVNVCLTLWNNDDPKYGQTLNSMDEYRGVGIHNILGMAKIGLATIVYAKVDEFRAVELQEMLLRIFRFDMALDPSFDARLVLWRTNSPSAAVHIADDRGLAMVTTDPLFAGTIGAKFAQFVY